ncbi:hypothetical protein CVT24_007435 [Panaeolus cyanescens]|uniref:Uncharacterized protein n=1 Tax=Panaeolus cyanescens TaxID=181874 RepID=A0A409YMA3_9AGAR|nr:hypothetical protein CVT24_007435 [Panaeolus cyanescens]
MLALETRAALDPTYGAMLVGVIFAAFFQGLLTVQAFNYFEKFPKDKLRIKCMVISLVAYCSVFDTVHLILIGRGAYVNLITDWGVVSHLPKSPVELNLHLIFTAVSVAISQTFFLARIWNFSHHNIFVLVPLVVLALTPLVLEVYITSRIAGDTLVMQYFKTGDEALAVFITSAVEQYFAGHGAGFYYIAIHFQLGRTYINALLATLNSRQSMRRMLTTHSFAPMPSNVLGSSHAELDQSKIICMVETKTETEVSIPSPTEAHPVQAKEDEGPVNRSYDIEKGPQGIQLA